jgi:hypothetical protein
LIRYRRIAATAAALAASAAFIVGFEPANASIAWAPAATAQIHPGVQTLTAGSLQCTANFIFQDSAGKVYIGQAAHCASLGSSTQTNGCTTPSYAIGTNVQVTGAQYTGKLVYSSWRTMQGLTPVESNGSTCAYNDFALVELDSRDYARVNPSVPYFGGPTGLRATIVPTYTRVHSYGNSSLRAGIAATSPKRGVSLGDSGGGWTHGLYTVTQGIPGDSGSGFLDATGLAFGVLSTISVAPIPASNNAGDLAKELDYMHAHSSFSATLVNGTQPFDDPVL